MGTFDIADGQRIDNQRFLLYGSDTEGKWIMGVFLQTTDVCLACRPEEGRRM